MKSVNGILSRYWLAFLSAGLLLVYGHLAWLDPILERDDRHILRFLKTWDDVRYLVGTGKWGELIVYQPLKDVSLSLDLQLTRWLGHGTFHLTNVLIWALCCWFALRLIEDDPARDKAPGLSARLGVLLFSIHPIFVGSVAWVSARKHLLSFLFILIATWELVRDEKPRKRLEVHWRALLWYALALLCHPIQILWPLWLITRAGWVEKRGSSRRRIFLRTASVALVPLVLAGLANVVYYSGLYVKHVGATKVVGFTQSGLGVPLLALGRYVMNLLLPIRLAPVYEPASWLGICGLLILPAIVISSRKMRSSGLVGSWLLFGLLPLLVVLMRMTQVFVSDTYALSAGFGVLAAVVTVWGDLKPRGGWVPATLGLLSAFYLALSLSVVASWKSDSLLWARAARLEPTARTLTIHARMLMDEQKFDEASRQVRALERSWPGEPSIPYLSARLLAEDSAIPVERRVAALSSNDGGPESRTWAAYFLAELYASQGKFSPAYESMKRSLASPGHFLTDLPAVVAELQYLCAQAGKGGCREESEEMRDRILAAGQLYWDDRPFNDRLKELDGLGTLRGR